jgi:hypothetical protein
MEAPRFQRAAPHLIGDVGAQRTSTTQGLWFRVQYLVFRVGLAAAHLIGDVGSQRGLPRAVRHAVRLQLVLELLRLALQLLQVRELFHVARHRHRLLLQPRGVVPPQMVLVTS